jgi:hypothetical protein
VLVGVAFIGTACAPIVPLPLRIPLVDHTGVDEGKYSRDLGYCYNHPPFAYQGNYVATCLREKGYTILAEN